MFIINVSRENLQKKITEELKKQEKASLKKTNKGEMKNLEERLEGIACIKNDCEFYNEKFEQNCQAGIRNETFVKRCKNYVPEKNNDKSEEIMKIKENEIKHEYIIFHIDEKVVIKLTKAGAEIYGEYTEDGGEIYKEMKKFLEKSNLKECKNGKKKTMKGGYK